MAKYKEIRRTLRRPFETGGFKLLKILIPLLPRPVVIGVSRLVGKVMCALPLSEKEIGLKNLDAVFGDTKTPAEKRQILTASLASFCLTMLDLFWFSKNPKKRIQKYVEFNDSFSPFFQDQAHILITAHFGNWEVMGQAMALSGAPVAGIAATIKNKQVDVLFRKLRETTGEIIIPQKGALRTLIARLRKKNKVGFVLDQHTSAREGGIQVDFLGLPMLVSPAPAALAYRTGTEIFFGFSKPMPSGKYEFYSLGTLQPPPFDKAADSDQIALDLTQQIEDRISAEIRAHPEHWLWSYRHWRRSEITNYPPHYPDY